MRKAVCILSQRNPNPIFGGIERVSYSLAKVLSNYGYVVFFVYGIETNDNLFENQFNSYKLPSDKIDSDENYSYLGRVLLNNNCYIVLNQASNIMDYVDLCANLVANNHSFRLVSAIHFSPLQALAAVRCNRFMRRVSDNKSIRLVLSKFINDLFLDFKVKKIEQSEKNLIQKVSQTSLKVVVLSDSFLNEFNTIALRNNFIAIPNMLELKDMTFPMQMKDKVVLYVGRLEYGLKRVDRLLYIWKEVEKMFSDWKLEIVGDGDYRHSFEDLSHRLGLKQVSFVGRQNPDDYYKKASIICLTSSCEGFGMVLVEAMQYGCVPIAYNSYASLSDIIQDGVNGYAVTAFNKNEYVAKLSQLMRNNELRRKMAENALLVPPKFDAHIIAQKWVNLFDSLA